MAAASLVSVRRKAEFMLFAKIFHGQTLQVRTKFRYRPKYFKYDVGRKSYVNTDVGLWNGEEFENPPVHPESSREYPGLYSGKAPPMGKVYDKKPFRIDVQAGKVYEWCTCGLSKTQPFCDKTHMYEEGNAWVKTKPRFRPVKYLAREDKTVYFCNCKQTKNRPFCDNTHKEQFVRESSSTVRD